MCKVTHCVQSYTLYVKLHTEYKSSFTLIVNKIPITWNILHSRRGWRGWQIWDMNQLYHTPLQFKIWDLNDWILHTVLPSLIHSVTLLNTQASVTPNITQSYNTVTHAERVTHIGVHPRPFFPWIFYAQCIYFNPYCLDRVYYNYDSSTLSHGAQNLDYTAT